MEEVEDVKHGIAGITALASWALAHQTEIGFFFASTISTLTIAYLIQGIIIRYKEINRNNKKR